jgi:hypothetical protein
MNFGMLGRFIAMLGIVIAAYAGYQYATNQPLKVIPRAGTGSLFEDLDNIGNALNTMGENMQREARRRSAARTAGIGTIVLFLGIAVSASAGTRQPEVREASCPQCGKNLPHDAHHLRCPGCGHSLLAESAPVASEAGRCPQCKRFIPPDEHGRFCCECGAALVASGGPPRS